MTARHSSTEQLSLDIGAYDAGSLPLRLRPMVPLRGDGPFDDESYFFEPWWPGASALLYIEGDAMRLQSEHLADPLHAFPELAVIRRQFVDDGLVIEGTLLVLDDEGRPDAELLRRRLADGDTNGPRGERAGTPAYVASDLLYRYGRPLLGRPFDERRRQLTRALTDGDTCVVSRGLPGEGLTLADAVASMGLNDISAKLLTGRYRPGQQDDSWLRLPVSETPARPTRPLLALLQRLPL